MSRRCHCTDSQMCVSCATLFARATGTTTPDMTHAQLQNQVRLVSKDLQLLHFHIRRPRTKEEEGLPDSLMCAPAGHPLAGVLWIQELKVGKDRPTVQQQAWLDALACVTRVESGVLRPETLKAFVHRLMQHS
jgi:hypothetical protein